MAISEAKINHPVQLFVRTAGTQGPAVLLLHGLGASSQVWQGVSRLLERRYRLFIPDLRGHGQSPAPPSGYLPEDYAVDLLEVMDRFHLPWAHLVGHSLGALVASTFAALWPDRVDRLVLLDPGLGTSGLQMLEIFRKLMSLREKGVGALVEYFRQLQPWASRATLELTAQLWRKVAAQAVAEILDHPEAFFRVDETYFDQIYAPTLIVGGDPAHGALLDQATGEVLAQRLRYGRFVRIEGAPHAVHAVKLKELVTLVDAFLADTEPLAST